MNALARTQEWLEEIPSRLTPSVHLRVLPRLVVPAPRLPGWRPWKPVVLPGGLPILNAFSIVQHAITTSGVTSNASGNTGTVISWSTNPTNGNLLCLALTFRGNATTSESTSPLQNWIKGPTITNGTLCQTEIWYRVAGAGEGSTGPTFTISATTLFEIAMAEATGFTGTPTLDVSGTATGSNVSTLNPVVSSVTTADNDFVFACCGNAEGSTAGVVFNASTANGNATLGADIDTVNAPKNGEGLRDTWATAGLNTTTPGIVFNLSSTSHTVLAGCIVAFMSVAVANVYLPPRGTHQAVPRGSYW